MTRELTSLIPITITLPGPDLAHVQAICIDTATHMASIALIEGGEVRAEQTWDTKMQHTRQLLGQLRARATEIQYELSKAQLICVCNGPGSFNGIRTGLAIALGLSVGFKIPVYGISSLDTLAFPHAEHAVAQRVLIPAGRGEYYSGLFGTRGGRWKRISDYSVAPLEILAQDSPEKAVWCGNIQEEDKQQLITLLGGSRRIIPMPHTLRRASYMLPLGMAAALEGAPGTWDTLQPLYIRKPGITLPKS